MKVAEGFLRCEMFTKKCKQNEVERKQYKEEFCQRHFILYIRFTQRPKEKRKKIINFVYDFDNILQKKKSK